LIGSCDGICFDLLQKGFTVGCGTEDYAPKSVSVFLTVSHDRTHGRIAEKQYMMKFASTASTAFEMNFLQKLIVS